MKSLLEKLWAHTSATALKSLCFVSRLNTFFLVHFIQTSARMCSTKNIIFGKKIGKLTRKCLCRSFFLIRLYTIKHATLLKRDFSSDVLLWILRKKHLLYRTLSVSFSHFNSTFLTLRLRRTYILIYIAIDQFLSLND